MLFQIMSQLVVPSEPFLNKASTNWDSGLSRYVKEMIKFSLNASNEIWNYLSLLYYTSLAYNGFINGDNL
jgi:hypothetical protein